MDVKGRRFPAGDEQRQYWKNWSTRDDLRGLAAWEQLFGAGFRGMLVFAYAIAGDRSPLPAERLFEFRERLYGFVGVRLHDYACFARPISSPGRRWHFPVKNSARSPGRSTRSSHMTIRTGSRSAQLASAFAPATIER